MTPNEVIVRLKLFFDDAVNNTVIATLAYQRRTPRDTSNSDSVAYQTASKERMLAMLAGNLVDGYTATISTRETLAVPAGTAPAIVPGGVGNSVSGAAGVAAGSWIGTYGTSLSAATKALTTADLVSGSIPMTLGGVGVQSTERRHTCNT